MVLKSKKSKSKRTTLSKKYKIIKKVKAHLKKKAKQEKGKQHKAPKDPGIPAQWPFKDELLKDLAWQRQRILAQEKERKANNKLKRVRPPGHHNHALVLHSWFSMQDLKIFSKRSFVSYLIWALCTSRLLRANPVRRMRPWIRPRLQKTCSGRWQRRR